MEIRIKKTEIYWLVTKAEWDCKHLIIAGLHWYNSLHRYNLRASDLLSELQPQIYQVMSMCLKMLSLTLKIPFHIHLPLRKRKKKKKETKWWVSRTSYMVLLVLFVLMSLKNFLYLIRCDYFLTRENEQLSKYGDTKTARSIMLIELKKLIEANPLFREKLVFPTLKSSRLRTLINQRYGCWCMG